MSSRSATKLLAAQYVMAVYALQTVHSAGAVALLML
jgi:hypothetical protein